MDILDRKIPVFKLGKNPVVVLPVSFWENLREQFVRLQEFYEMSNSKKYKKDIAKARMSKKEVSSQELYKSLGLI
jgi:hypothetical protein